MADLPEAAAKLVAGSTAMASLISAAAILFIVAIISGVLPAERHRLTPGPGGSFTISKVEPLPSRGWSGTLPEGTSGCANLSIPGP